MGAGSAELRASRTDASRLVRVALVAGLVSFALQAVLLAHVKYFSLDEFQYAHAAWLVAQGQVPYRDFFEVHFPLVYQVLAPVFLVAGDDPRAITLLRLGMLPFLLLACVAAAVLNRGQGRVATLAAPLLLLALPPFVTLATEIRPDAVACALFLAALAALRSVRASDQSAGFASGLLAVASVWGSQKAAFYGAVFALAFVIDVTIATRGGSAAGARRLLRSPAAFVLGAASGLATIAAYLTATASWTAWWEWCFAWAAAHQRGYPGFGWGRYLFPILLDAPWLFALAVWGATRTAYELRARGRDALQSADLLLLAALASTFASFALQRAPYPYSLLPFLAVTTILAARAVADLLGGRTRPVLRAAAGLVLLAGLALQGATLARFVAASSAGQLAVLERVARLTAPTDAAYDNSGGYVARPHAYRYFYTDSFLRESIPETLVREVPQAILDRGAVLHLRDLRFDTLPAPLRTFLATHFQPLDGDVALWGQHYVVPAGGPFEATFLAVRDDAYFVTPATALEHGVLTIDGVPVTEPVFRLAKGERRIVYTGPPGELDILWLPRDGRPWQAQRGLAPTFSRIF